MRKKTEAPLIDWFGNRIEQKPSSENPCVQLYGAGPESKTCRQCSQIAGIRGASKTFFKCKLRKATHGSGTDHKISWPACARFEQRSGDIPVYDRRH